MEGGSLSTKDLRNDKRLKSLTLLLKCLKIMENATFLSKDNQVKLCFYPTSDICFSLFFFGIEFCMRDLPSVLNNTCWRLCRIHSLVNV